MNETNQDLGYPSLEQRNIYGTIYWAILRKHVKDTKALGDLYCKLLVYV